MIAKPEIGQRCFIIIDIHEVLLPAPAEIVSERGGVFVARWDMGEGYFEDYENLLPEELYETKEAATAAIEAQRRLEQ